MKYALMFFFFFPLFLCAQKPFSKVWESKVSVEPKWNDYYDDLSLILQGDLTELEMVDGATGKSLWIITIKEVFGVKSCQTWVLLEDYDVVKITYKKPKSDDQTIEFLEARTGKKTGDPTTIAAPEKGKKVKRVKSKSRFVFESMGWDEASGTSVSIGYDDKKWRNATGGTVMKMTVSASGGFTWSTSFEGKIVSHLCPELIEGDVILNLFIAYNKVFVVHEGITVLDLRTGKLLWATTFDYTDTDTGLKATQEIGRTSFPEITEDAVYICDLTKGEKAVKKLNIQTGEVIWTGQKLSKNDIISYIAYIDGTLIVKYGGIILKESYIPNTNGGSLSKVEYVFEGTTSIEAFDAATGKMKWTSEKWDNGDNFKKSPCNLMEEKGKIYICSDKFFYRIDPQTGNAEIKTTFGAKEIGMPQYMYFFDSAVIIEGDEGIASVNEVGKLNYSTSTGKCLMTQDKGDAYIVWTGKDMDDRKHFVRFDRASGQIMGKMEDCYHPRFDTTGDYFLKFDDSKLMKFSTKP